MSASRNSVLWWLIRLGLAFIIIVAGVYVGVTLALQLRGDQSSSKLTSISEGERLPKHLLVGSSLPDFVGIDQNQQIRELGSVLVGDTTLIAFVSAECGPCQSLVDHLNTTLLSENARRSVVLVSTDPEQFTGGNEFRQMKVGRETFDNLGIQYYPLMLAVDHNRKIWYAHAGFLTTNIPNIPVL